MKKTILTVILMLCAACFIGAQTPKGTVSLGVDAEFSKDNDENGSGNTQTKYNSQYFSAGPSIGWFVANNVEIGVSVDYRYSKGTYQIPYGESEQTLQNVETWSKYSEFSVTPFVSFYKMFGEKFGMFLKASGSIEKGTETDRMINYPQAYAGILAPSFSERKYKTTSWNVSASPGFIFFPAKNWGIIGEIGGIEFGSQTHQEDPDVPENKSKSTGFSFDLEMSWMSLGVKYFFGK